jgi:hypothetical protein
VEGLSRLPDVADADVIVLWIGLEINRLPEDPGLLGGQEFLE